MMGHSLVHCGTSVFHFETAHGAQRSSQFACKRN
jgi:hypothetical protein